MEDVTVSKKDLLATLEHNRQVHRRTFERAQEKYREAMIAELDRALEDAREGRKITRAFALPVPEDHTSDFDTAIEMLKWEQADSVTLHQREFMNYVQNKWGWMASFAANTESYLVQ